jgi:hypothetical protein
MVTLVAVPMRTMLGAPAVCDTQAVTYTGLFVAKGVHENIVDVEMPPVASFGAVRIGGAVNEKAMLPGEPGSMLPRKAMLDAAPVLASPPSLSTATADSAAPDTFGVVYEPEVFGRVSAKISAAWLDVAGLRRKTSTAVRAKPCVIPSTVLSWDDGTDGLPAVADHATAAESVNESACDDRPP